MRAARAGPVLRGQCFANEQILRGPVLAARKGPVQACLQGTLYGGTPTVPTPSLFGCIPYPTYPFRSCSTNELMSLIKCI